MKCVYKVLVCLLAFGVVGKANPISAEQDNEIQRETRQMKQEITPDQTERKLFGQTTALGTAATDALQAVAGALANNLQTGRINGNLMLQNLQGPYAIPVLGYGVTGLNANSAGNVPLNAAFVNYPGGADLYRNQLLGTGLYGNTGVAGVAGTANLGNLSPLSQLDNAINLGNQQGLNTQFIAQQSQVHRQIAPFPLMPEYFPQIGYNQAYQNFQG